MANKAYEAIATTIINLLEQGVVPWQRPWTVTGEGPTNISSGKAYRGGNWFFLGLMAHVHGYGSNVWGTYKQIKEKGGQVRKGEKSTPCVWYSAVPAKGEDGKPIFRDGEQVFRRIAKSFRVFNIAQCDGLEHLLEQVGEANHRSCAEIFDNMPKRPIVVHGGDRACYSRSSDIVTVPNPSRFEAEAHYWATVFHELAHSTGHGKRLGRFETRGWDSRFGDEVYSEEELVAEFASSFLCGVAGIERQTIDASASYIDHWRRSLSEKPQAFARALIHASRAADFVLDRQQSE